MEQRDTPPQQASSYQAEAPRRHPQKSVRVAFGPDLDTQIPPRERSPLPPSNHHRSFTAVEQQKPPPPGRPTSSSGENTSSVENSSRYTSDQASEGAARPTAALKRAKSDYGPRGGFDKPVVVDNEDEEDFAMRHGWQEEFTSSEYLKVLHSVSKSGV